MARTLHSEPRLERVPDGCDLERALWFLYQQWALLGYRPVGFYRMFSPQSSRYKGGIAAVRWALRNAEGESFEFLEARGKQALSLESLVLREPWSHLFTDQDKRIARERCGRFRRVC